MVVGAQTTTADVRLMSAWEAGVRAGAATQRDKGCASARKFANICEFVS